MSLSISEDNGIALLQPDDLNILSVGVSTGGIAEIRMAKGLPQRHIIATTIDEHGLNDAKKYIQEQGFEDQIELRLEDVSEKLPYEDESFDYIYARLVLHYLSKDKLAATLKELFRVLKKDKILYVVVRSKECPDANGPGVTYDETTGYTHYSNPIKDHPVPILQRFFHTEESITKFVQDAGFKVEYVASYEERIYADFMRTVEAPHTDYLIELRAKK